jgi:hypothetical protein
MDRNPRNQSLLAQLSETNPFKAELVHHFFAIGNGFQKAVEDVGSDGRLSLQGRKEKAREHAAKALRELDDAARPITAYRKETETLRAGMRTPVYDRTDKYAADLRRELRDRSCIMSPAQRAGKLVGPGRDVAFIDAVMEQPCWCSNINPYDKGELEIFETAKAERLRELNSELVRALDARGAVDAEISMVANIIRTDITSAATDLAARAA